MSFNVEYIIQVYGITKKNIIIVQSMNRETNYLHTFPVSSLKSKVDIVEYSKANNVAAYFFKIHLK